MRYLLLETSDSCASEILVWKHKTPRRNRHGDKLSGNDWNYVAYREKCRRSPSFLSVNYCVSCLTRRRQTAVWKISSLNLCFKASVMSHRCLMMDFSWKIKFVMVFPHSLLFSSAQIRMHPLHLAMNCQSNLSFTSSYFCCLSNQKHRTVTDSWKNECNYSIPHLFPWTIEQWM